MALLAGLIQVRLRHVQFIRDHLQITLQLLVDFVFFGQPLRQRLIGLLHGGLRRLLHAVSVV